MADQDEITELERRIVRLVRDGAPPGWQRLGLRCQATVAADRLTLTALTADGQIITAEQPPGGLADLLARLRRAHYLSEQGTWFSVTFLVEPDAAQPYYNYDFDPMWDPPLERDAWTRDQIVLPRDGAHVPEWLRDRLEGREPVYRAGEHAEPLNPVEQMELLSNRFTLLAADQGPPLWRKIFGYYQACGDHVEFPPPMAYLADGTMGAWTPSPAVAVLLDRLRAGTHGFQGRTWWRMDFELLYEEGGVRCRASYTYDREPPWNRAPGAGDVRRELERFPGGEVPDWMTRILETAPHAADAPHPEPAQPAEPAGMRQARVFDQIGPNGENPSVSRPEVPADEAGPLLEYLRAAPVVMAARSSGPDQIDASRGDRVPLTFHTDGHWTWPGAVAYYLAEHGVPPEPELVAHARARGFVPPAVGEETMGAAIAAVTGRDEPPRLRTDWPARAARRLAELGVEPDAYRIGGTREGAWCLLEEGGRWRVFKYVGGERLKEVAFDSSDDAAAHLLGRTLLVPFRRRPIEPLDGEPPLNLFRDQREIEVPAGTVVDRYGDPAGNVAYAEGTPFERRSLPPDWANRPYRAYRLQRPVRALTGIAVPWFDQPGGGTAYVFARSMADLVEDGSATEAG
ncbi:TNT domain-containing protein [Actinomadura macrotermitis]|uniref:TNT domain-containing protein n=1 Tax=Actinomadura macrotermitis TaxID=2585200 RepID=UPI002E2741A2|nr:glycohydrolase toxin TNT-related protein [Actinomadura macrotermitis]